MSFDAGSIEAKLKLDRSDFQRGLDEAKQQGEDFEHTDYTAKVKLDGTAEAESELAGIDATYAALRENLQRTIKVEVDADTAAADAELEATTALADRLDHKRVNVGVAAGAMSAITALGGAFGKMGENISEGTTVATPLFSLIIGVAPLAVAALAPLLGIAGALGAAFTAAAVSIGGVAIVAMPLITKMVGDYQKLTAAQAQYKAATTGAQRAAALQAEAKATDNLTGSEKGLFGMLQQVMGLYHRLQSEFAKPLASALTPWFAVAKAMIGLLPLIIGPALGSIKVLGQVVQGIVQSPSFRAFIRLLGEFGAFALKQFGLAGIAIAHAFAEMLVAFMPLARVILPGIVQLARAFATWAEGLSSSSGFHQFIKYVMDNGPLLGSLLISLLTIFIKLMIGLAPLGHVMLLVTAAVAKFLSVLTPNELLAIIAVVTLLGLALALAFAGVPLLIAGVVAAVVAVSALLVNFWPDITKAWSAAIGVIERNVIKPIISFFSDKLPHAFDNFTHFWISGWHAVQHIAEEVWKFLTHGWGQYIILPLFAIRKAVEFLRGGWKQTWQDIKNIALDAWNWLHDHVYAPLINVVTKTVPNAFHTGVDAVKTAWQRLGDAVKAPVKWVIGNVVNGLIRAFDWVSHRVGGPQIPIFQIGFQSGGRVPGYGGGDILPALLEPGETVVSKEHSRTPMMRAAFESAGVPGYQLGGLVGGIGHFFGSVFNEVKDVGRAALAVGTGNRTALTNAILDMIPGGVHGAIADMARLLTALPAKLLHEAVSKLLSFGGGQGVAGMRNPLRAIRGLVPERIDMGVDYAGTGPIYAIGPGVITHTDPSGWPGTSFINERLTGTPYSGKYIYFSENISPRVHVGQKVGVNDVIGIMTGGIEAGWASGIGAGAMAAQAGQAAGGSDPGANLSAYGANFNQLMMALGVPSGTGGGRAVGRVAKGFYSPQTAGGGARGSYSVAGMAQLWRNVGGAANLAHLMGAIGMAESRGDPRVVNSIGASGLWQILMPQNAGYVHGNVLNPMVNAAAAHAIYLAQGLRAWEAYTNGSYRQFMDSGGYLPPGTSIVHNNTGGFEKVVPPGANLGDLGGLTARLDRLIRAVEQNAIATASGVADALNGVSRSAAYRSAYSTRGG